jgi:hypothetical protein
MINAAVRREVGTRVISSWLAETPPCIYGCATLAIVRFGDCNNAAAMEEIAIIVRSGTFSVLDAIGAYVAVALLLVDVTPPE